MVVVDASFRMVLRSDTAADHGRLDALVERSAPVSDPDGARRFLTVMYAVVGSFAAALDRSSTLAGLEPRSTLLLGSLESDLGELGVDPSTVTAGLEPIDDATAWGVGYVLEGSALGASILRQQAKAAGMPLAYLSALDEGRPVRWSAFSSALNGAAVSERPGIIDAARRIFGRVETELLSLVGGESASAPT